MDTRLEISDETLLAAIEQLTLSVARRVSEKGRQSYVSAHESLGIVTEEYHRLVDAVKSDNPVEIAGELADVAVSCVYAIASMLQYEVELKAARLELDKNISSVGESTK